MTLDLVPADVRGADRDALIAFLTTHEWPFHVRRRQTVETVTAALVDGAFDDEDHAAFWIVEDGARIGLAVLQDLTDDTPLFDLRLATDARGHGRGLAALQALTAHVFNTRPQTDRIEGQTRADNVAMRRRLRPRRVREGGALPGGMARGRRPFPGLDRLRDPAPRLDVRRHDTADVGRRAVVHPHLVDDLQPVLVVDLLADGHEPLGAHETE